MLGKLRRQALLRENVSQLADKAPDGYVDLVEVCVGAVVVAVERAVDLLEQGVPGKAAAALSVALHLNPQGGHARLAHMRCLGRVSTTSPL